MRLNVYGAAREVTGSCYMLEVGGKNILVDCGMVQGPDIYEEQKLAVSASSVHCMLLTHAHIDHSGLIPLLVRNGFKGKIYMTRPTRDLACLMLKDSAHIQESEADWRNRKAKRTGAAPYSPIYNSNDVLAAIKQFKACDYETEYELFKGVRVRFYDAGHLLGSSSIYVEAEENGEKRRIVFSGDIGNKHKPILRDPTYLTQADYVLTESTYGDRRHGAECDHVKELADIIQRTLDRGGNVVIPSFAVGRMQEMLFYLRQIKDRKLILDHNDFPVYVDSPLAVEATKLFSKKYDCFQTDMLEYFEKGINPLSFSGLKLAVKVEDSKAINNDPTPKVILSASGMCEAGRIRHHLKYNLWKKESSVVFVGYQVEGTLGRALLDGAREVNLFGETVMVEAEICKLNATSSHADVDGLMEWISAYSPKPRRVFVTHGEESVAKSYAEKLVSELGINAVAPKYKSTWDLINDLCIDEGFDKKEKKEEKSEYPKSQAYKRLELAGKELVEVIKENQGGTNYDLKRFADELEKLCKRWKREDN
ncbi:MAG: MBL fold metallo-hydrolase [Clostridia bacterium]|nr:MBL fold metallo-hydrolase [Clostridia bacterium]